MLRRKPMIIALVAGAAAQLALRAFHLPAMECPVPRLFHIPCPGCGLTRACLCLLRGQWRASLHMHAFGTPVLLVGLLFLIAIFLRDQRRLQLADWLERVERRSTAPASALVLLHIYWIVRLIYIQRGIIV
jgi:hypothetical protein